MAWCFGEPNQGTSIREIARSLPIDKRHGIGLFDLARAPIQRGYHVEMFAWDAEHFPIRWLGAPSDEIRQDVIRRRPKSGSWKAALLHDLQAGAVFHAEPLSEREIKRRLAAGQQVVLYINSAVMYGHHDGVWGHYVALLKIEGQTWTIMDPHWKHGGIKKYPRDLLLFAFWSVGGYGLFLSRSDDL